MRTLNSPTELLAALKLVGLIEEDRYLKTKEANYYFQNVQHNLKAIFNKDGCVDIIKYQRPEQKGIPDCMTFEEYYTFATEKIINDNKV